MPNAPESLVINTGPLIALGKIDAFDIIKQLPIRFSTPRQVAGEIEAGARLGHPVIVPPWVAIHDLSGDVLPLGPHVLDLRESAVIQLAIERKIRDVASTSGAGAARPCP